MAKRAAAQKVTGWRYSSTGKSPFIPVEIMRTENDGIKVVRTSGTDSPPLRLSPKEVFKNEYDGKASMLLRKNRALQKLKDEIKRLVAFEPKDDGG